MGTSFGQAPVTKPAVTAPRPTVQSGVKPSVPPVVSPGITHVVSPVVSPGVLTDPTAKRLCAMISVAATYEAFYRNELVYSYAGTDPNKVSAVVTRLLAGPSSFQGTPLNQTIMTLRTYLTEAEALELIRFFDTPVGRKYLTFPLQMAPTFKQIVAQQIQAAKPQIEAELGKSKAAK